MDGTTSNAVNYLLSPMSNDYYDHRSLQPMQSLSNVSYYHQTETVDCFYDHHKTDYTSSNGYVYSHPVEQTTPTFSYGSSMYNVHPNQSYMCESTLTLLQPQARLPPVYEVSPSSQISPSCPIQNSLLNGTTLFKREKEETVSGESAIPIDDMVDKNQVYDWMKGLQEFNV